MYWYLGKESLVVWVEPFDVLREEMVQVPLLLVWQDLVLIFAGASSLALCVLSFLISRTALESNRTCLPLLSQSW